MQSRVCGTGVLPSRHDGQITSVCRNLVKSQTGPIAKIFRFTGIPIYGRNSVSPCHQEGRFAVVTKRGAGCDGTLAASGDLHPAKRWQRPAKSCGPGAATLASIRSACVGLATVAKKAVHRGEHEVSRQTIARGRPGCPGCTCSLCPCASACGMPVCSGARDLRVLPAPGLPCALCPREANVISRTRVKTLPRERERMIRPAQLSFPLNPVSIRNKY
jgi:hypothetical protein